MELFKFCRHEHLLSMKNSGSVRIGTLSDYRKTDKHGELISDEFEGSKRMSGSISNINSENAHKYPGLEGLVKVESGGGMTGQLTFNNCVFSVPDLLIFSATKEYSQQIHELWDKNEGYNSCYKIISPRLFFRAISEALGSNYNFLGFAEVHYADEIDIASPQAGIHPALVKRHAGYADQAEIRAIWQPVNANAEDIEPIVLQQSGGSRYITSHRILHQN